MNMKTDNIAVLSPPEAKDFTPRQALLELLEIADELESVVAVYTLKETGTSHICSSDCTARDQAWAGAMLTDNAMGISKG